VNWDTNQVIVELAEDQTVMFECSRFRLVTTCISYIVEFFTTNCLLIAKWKQCMVIDGPITLTCSKIRLTENAFPLTLTLKHNNVFKLTIDVIFRASVLILT